MHCRHVPHYAALPALTCCLTKRLMAAVLTGTTSSPRPEVDPQPFAAAAAATAARRPACRRADGRHAAAQLPHATAPLHMLSCMAGAPLGTDELAGL